MNEKQAGFRLRLKKRREELFAIIGVTILSSVSYPTGTKYEPGFASKSINIQGARGAMVRAVACEARGPGFDSSSDQLFFLSSGIRR